MIVEIRLRGLAGTAGLVVCALVVCGVLARQILFNFIVFSLSDSRSPVSAGALETATSYFPTSARLNARLAEAEISDPSRDVALAGSEIERAIRLSPNDYKLRVVLALVKESQGDITGAESALRDAASLAPSNMEVRWRLANLLLRAGQISDALTEFRAVVSGNQALIPVTLDLVWNVTGGDVSSLEAVLPATPQAKMQLASLLLKRGRTAEAAEIFGGIDADMCRSAPASSDFVNGMVNSGELALARALWIKTVSASPVSAEATDSALVWNGGFESDPIPGLAQFDWNLGESKYATLRIDTSAAHLGSRSLRLDFAGRDTTSLDGEIKQRVVLSPGRHYKLNYYVKTRDFVTSDGPRLALICSGDPSWSPTGEAIAAGTADWRKMELDFGTPTRGSDSRDRIAVTVKVIRIPRFSYDEPMRGTIWLDDFTIVEAGQE